MATYPDDAQAPITAFSVVAETEFSSTGTTRTEFNLPSTVEHKGEITAFIDGILQQTTAYDLSNSGQTASFLVAPNASNLTIKTISLPSRFKLTRTFPAVRSVEYSNTSATVVDSNSYLINGNTEFFALPSGNHACVIAKALELVRPARWRRAAGLTPGGPPSQWPRRS